VAGGRAPAIEAARIEPLVKATRSGSQADTSTFFVLYGRIVASGLDETIATRVAKGEVDVLAGATAEFALVAPGGKLIASGVRSVFQSSNMNLAKPESLEFHRVAYAGVERQRT